MKEIVNQDIEFKYLITMNYPYRVTDYTRVLRDSKHLKHVIRSNIDCAQSSSSQMRNILAPETLLTEYR